MPAHDESKARFLTSAGRRIGRSETAEWLDSLVAPLLLRRGPRSIGEPLDLHPPLRRGVVDPPCNMRRRRRLFLHPTAGKPELHVAVAPRSLHRQVLTH